MKTKKSNIITINHEILKKFNPAITNKGEDRKQYDFWKVVNYDKENREITVLDYVFNDTMHEKPFNGATGSKFDIISKAEYKERMKKSNIIDYLKSASEFPMDFDSFNEWYKAIKDANELETVIFDNSYSHLHDYIRAELKLNKTEAYIFSCSGGGRCFKKGFKGNINPELSEVINQFEG